MQRKKVWRVEKRIDRDVQKREKEKECLKDCNFDS